MTAVDGCVMMVNVTVHSSSEFHAARLTAAAAAAVASDSAASDQ